MKQETKKTLLLLFIVVAFSCGGAALWPSSPACGGINPQIVGDGDNDSVYVIFAVNDTLGNAIDYDSVTDPRGLQWESRQPEILHGGPA